MNPVFIAYMQAMMKVKYNMMMGIKHEPKAHKPIEEGPAFAVNEAEVIRMKLDTPFKGRIAYFTVIDDLPRSDMVQEME